MSKVRYDRSRGEKYAVYRVKGKEPFGMSGEHNIEGRGVVLHEKPDDLGVNDENGDYIMYSSII